MDFLDPKKRRAHRIRLMIGYVLMTVIIGIGTVILVYEAYGFGYNRETGQVVQNGLVFLDSAPVSSDIYINGQKHESGTDARLVLPANQYKFELKRSGYHDWQRSLYLQPGSLERLVYPIMVPTSFSPKTSSEITFMDPLYSQSPDRRWLLIQAQTSAVNSLAFELFDTSVKPNPQKSTLQLPVNIVRAAGGKLTEVEWSSDNKHALLQYDTEGSVEFILVDREEPSRSLNINNRLNVAPSIVMLKDKKIDQLYIHNQTAGSLSIANLNQGIIAQPFLQKVIAFKPYGNDVISYITENPSSAGTVKAIIWEKGQSYNMQTLQAGELYLIDQARFDGHWYFVFGSNKQERVAVYKDPQASIKSQNKTTAVPMLSLNITNPQFLGFSANARFISVQSGQEFVVQDLEAKENFKYKIDAPLTGRMRWMDGHRLLGISSGKAYMFDFDGINRHLLINSALSAGAYFDRDYRQMYVVGTDSTKPGATVLQRVAMYSEADTPSNLR